MSFGQIVLDELSLDELSLDELLWNPRRLPHLPYPKSNPAYLFIFSYYGQGLKKNECGITINQPTQQDYGAWRCSIGVITHDSKKNFNRVLMLNKPGNFYPLVLK